MHACVQRRRYSKPLTTANPECSLSNAGAPGDSKLTEETSERCARLFVATGACPAFAGSYLPAVTSITERRTDYLYRKFVGWAMSERIDEDLTLQALVMGLEWRRPTSELMHHSDRGSQYAANEYRKVLAARGITVSMSRKANCWDTHRWNRPTAR